MWFFLGPTAKLPNNVTDPALSPFRLTSRSKSVDKSQEEFPKELMEDWSTMEVCVDCKKFISEIISSSRRSLSLANKRARLKRKTQSFYYVVTRNLGILPLGKDDQWDLSRVPFASLPSPWGHHPWARSLEPDCHPVASFHLTGLGLHWLMGFPTPAAPGGTERCVWICAGWCTTGQLGENQ